MHSGHLIVTVARQLGSGGSEIAQIVARRLGIAYIDRQILQDAAKELGLEEEELQSRCERLQGFWERLLHVFAQGSPASVYSPPPSRVPSDEMVMAAERDVLLHLASKGPCVVVGHCGFHLLRERGQLLNVFIHAPTDFRVARVMKHYGAKTPEEALESIELADKERGEYVQELSGALWEDATNYHLTLDAAFTGLERAAETITRIASPLLPESAGKAGQSTDGKSS
ncbi:Cytidylate kinase-like family [Desulfovibrio sp. X2]|uniref:cytidylate kinase-like family protein n=1 Tax=Desulfovibrio sp. X2 TaxID=941449 RepID=UPI000358F0D2|nr:cytidylate kinase-like family protein [Desulfovibrio sp. X2]EPR37356.1 Cytidylate kinase-like family [Desulfovibrio sp. X2]